MITAFFRWCVLTVAVWVAAIIVPGITFDGWRGIFVAALVLGILNAFVKPILKFLSLPFIILSFGLFLLVINALLLRLTAWLVGPEFHVAGFWPAVGGSLVISIVSMFLGYAPSSRRIVVDRTNSTPPHSDRRAPPGKGPIIDV